MTKTRKQIAEYETVIYGSYSQIDISELIHKLKHLRSQGFSIVESEKTSTVKAKKLRKETDKEYHVRIEKEEEQKRQSEDRRRRQYEKLRAEFGP